MGSSFQNLPSSGMPPTPLQTPSRILRTRALDDLFPFKPSSSDEEQFAMTQVTYDAPDVEQAIIVSATPDLQEYRDLFTVDAGCRLDLHGLKRDLEITGHAKQSFTEFQGSPPAQQIYLDQKIAVDQKCALSNLKPEKLIQKLPDWDLSDFNTTYDLKQYIL
jgi:hypothetical protein